MLSTLDSMYKYIAEFNHKEVPERALERRSNCYKVNTPGIPIFLERDFLSKEECESVVNAINRKTVPSVIFPPSNDSTYRNSRTSHMDDTDPLIFDINLRLSQASDIPPCFGERLQGQKYLPGQQFKKHYDSFTPRLPNEPGSEYGGGQRTWTFMIYLNEPEAGGATFFPNVGLKVKPRLGSLLVWYNLDDGGDTNPLSVHAGLQVEMGEKYILTKWFRDVAVYDPKEMVGTQKKGL